MFSLHCPTCDRNHLVSYGMIEAFENTDAGPIGVLRCHNGHQVVTDFGRSGHPNLATAA